MSTTVACEVALRCTSPEGPPRVCSFYVTYTPPTPGYPGWCKYVSTPAGFCGHPQARLIAFREAVREALGFLPDLSPPRLSDEEKKRLIIESRIQNDECPGCGLKLTFTDLGVFTGFDGDAQDLKRVSVVCQRCKSFSTRILTKDGKKCSWGELTAWRRLGKSNE